MSLEDKVSKSSIRIGIIAVVAVAALIGNAAEYLINSLYSFTDKKPTKYSQPLNNTTNSLIYTNR